MLSQHRLEAPQALLLLLSKNGIPNIQSLVPKLEDGILGYSRRISTFSFTFRRFDAYTSSKYWKKFEASLPRDPYRMDEVSRSAFLVTMARQMQQMQERDKYATTALRWCQQHRDWLYQIKGNISEETNNWCRVYGISHGVLLQCQAYRSILSLVKRDRIETVTKLLDSRKEELCFQAAAWQQREKEKASLQSYEETEKQIKALYNTLSTDPKSQRRQGFPCYKVFKTLPSVKSILQSSTTSPDHSKAQLKNPELKKVIGNDLDQWKERARNAVRLLLGYGDPSNKSGRGRNKAAQIWWDQPGKVAPELRRSSLFVCKMCNQLRKRQKRLGAMDFDGLCQHQCVLLDKASKDQPRWAPCEHDFS
ncbi:hypothetical protein FRC17_007155 [Serendipita sp. 399]|nr:hypothetical protein FRC17_007155 [Serendipita sp. 399]